MLGTILLIVLVLILIGGFAPWGGPRPFYGVGWGGGGFVGLLLVIVLILVLTGHM